MDGSLEGVIGSKLTLVRFHDGEAHGEEAAVILERRESYQLSAFVFERWNSVAYDLGNIRYE